MFQKLEWLVCIVLCLATPSALAIGGRPVAIISYDMGIRPVSPGFDRIDEEGWRKRAEEVGTDPALAGENSFGPKHQAFFTAQLERVEAFVQSGKFGTAVRGLQRVIALRRRYFGQVDYRQADGVLSKGYLRLAEILSRTGDRAAELEAWRLLTNHLFQRPQSGGTDCRVACVSGSWQDVHKAKRPYYMAHLLSLARFVQGGGGGTYLMAEAFDLIQLIENTQISETIGRMIADREAVAAGHADLVAARKELEEQIRRRERELVEARRTSMGPNDLTPQLIQSRLSSLKLKERQVAKTLERKYRPYHLIASSALMTIKGAREILREGEAYLMTVSGIESSVVLVIRPDAAMLYEASLGRARLDAAVGQLRSGLDPSRITSIKDLFRFDTATASMLYQLLFAPADDFLKGVSQLLLKLDGALQTLPPAVLLTKVVTSVPTNLDAFRAMPWLVKRFETTILPAVRTLYAIRKYRRPSTAKKPFLGIGDPLLKDHPGDSLRGVSGDKYRSVSGWLAQVKTSPETARIYRGKSVDIRALRELQSLPETAQELGQMAVSLGAGDASLRLREQAREGLVRQWPDLKNYRVIAFATHGLLGGEIDGVSHPALVLTPPKLPSERDDGLLTSAEIVHLRLDADWVILSACNTAAPEGSAGAEGMSGLTRAFFHAGARSLFVSHWPVASKATVRLTTRMLELLRNNPGLGRAAAHRQSMLALMNDRDEPIFAHPLFWAPFVVVGEGGAASIRQ